MRLPVQRLLGMHGIISVVAGALLLLLLMFPSPATGSPLPTESLSLTPRAYLPLILKAPACSLSPQEAEVARYMMEHPDQQRPSLTCHPILARVARERAEDMARRRYFSHVTPEGYGPNYLVRQAGYVLPSYYDQALDANNIESIAAGYPSASAVWNGWMSSPGHRTHLLGLHPFFAEQIEYGIGYAYDPSSPYQYYWVVITAKPGP
ncbi:MAG: CAP domain-containing protein [Anaerolineae bacterium]|nr:CAP domain-containing protein [Anaerolineae bacterium]